MPIYEYECKKCGKRFEYFHWSGEDEKFLKCPKCGAENPERVFSSFNGGGSDSSCGTRHFG